MVWGLSFLVKRGLKSMLQENDVDSDTAAFIASTAGTVIALLTLDPTALFEEELFDPVADIVLDNLDTEDDEADGASSEGGMSNMDRQVNTSTSDEANHGVSFAGYYFPSGGYQENPLTGATGYIYETTPDFNAGTNKRRSLRYLTHMAFC